MRRLFLLFCLTAIAAPTFAQQPDSLIPPGAYDVPTEAHLNRMAAPWQVAVAPLVTEALSGDAILDGAFIAGWEPMNFDPGFVDCGNSEKKFGCYEWTPGLGVITPIHDIYVGPLNPGDTVMFWATIKCTHPEVDHGKAADDVHLTVQ